MTTQAQLWIAAGALALLAGFSALAERLRSRRRDIDKPGWVPWTLIHVLAMTVAVVLVALAILQRR
jgi:hypothetical protein